MLAILKQIELIYALTTAFLPLNVWLQIDNNDLYKSKYIDKKYAFNTKIDIDLYSPKKYFFVGGYFDVIFAPSGEEQRVYSMSPLQNNYGFRIGAQYSRFEIGFNHFCTHPIATYMDNRAQNGALHGGYEEIYIKYSNKK